MLRRQSLAGKRAFFTDGDLLRQYTNVIESRTETDYEMNAYPATVAPQSQIRLENESKYPGFIIRSEVAEATRRAELNGVCFTRYNAQGL